jgi:signal peptidase I
MTDAIEKSKTRRKPWIAVVLSAILPGLGHIYCGQIVTGVVLMFMVSLFFPVLIFDTNRVKPTTADAQTGLLLMFSLMTILVGVGALIDSYRQARRTRYDYELKDYNKWFVYLALVVIFCGGAVGYSLQIRDKYIEAFIVPADSMVPTIFNGDRILANKTAYHTADPQPGDIVLFSNPDNRHQNYIKRVVALAGDTVEIKDGQLYINDKKLERTQLDPLTFNTNQGDAKGTVFLEQNNGAEYRIFLADEINGKTPPTEDLEKLTVDKYCCFVLGDNRLSSRDSRNFGPIPITSVRAKFSYLYFPSRNWSRFGPIK